MFRKRDPQGNLFESSMLLPEEKYRRLQGTWADVFRNQALCLISRPRTTTRLSTRYPRGLNL